MFARNALRSLAKSTPCMRQTIHRHKRLRLSQPYSSRSITDKNEEDRQDELSANDGENVSVTGSRDEALPIATPQDAQRLKGVTATQPEEHVPERWPQSADEAPPVKDIRLHGIDGAQDRLPDSNEAGQERESDVVASNVQDVQNANEFDLVAAEANEYDDDQGDEDEEDYDEDYDEDEYNDKEEVEREEELKMFTSEQHRLAVLEQYDRQDITPVMFGPAEASRKAYIHSGRGVASLAANNFEGIISDRIKAVAEMRQGGLRHAPTMARTMMRGGLVSFQSQEEVESVNDAAGLYAHKLKRSATAIRRGDDLGVSEHEFAPLTEDARKDIVDRYIKGKYLSDRHLRGNKGWHKDMSRVKFKGGDVSDTVIRNLIRNSTYLDRDISGMVKKLQSLVPAQQRTPAPKAATTTR